MKRILFVHHGKGIGGAPLSLLYLIRGLDPNEYEARVACLHESAAADLFRGAGIRTDILHGVNDFSHTNVLWYPWWQLPKTLLRLAQFPMSYVRAKRYFAGVRPDIVHLNTSTLTAAALAAKRCGARVVWHIREPLQSGYFGIRRSIIRRIIARTSDAILPICRYDASQLIQTPNIEVVYNFIDFAQFSSEIDGEEIRTELKAAPGAVVVLMLGGVNPIKGTAEFVTAALKVLETGKNVIFIVAGPVPPASFRNRLNGLSVYAKRLSSAIPEERKAAIRLIGIRSDVPKLLAASDILCFPSTVPHFARPVIEASAMQVPVIASDLGGPQELVVHEETGLLVPACDTDALASALIRLIDDPDLRKRFGRAGRVLAKEKFDAEKNTRQVIGVYRHLMEKSS